MKMRLFILVRFWLALVAVMFATEVRLASAQEKPGGLERPAGPMMLRPEPFPEAKEIAPPKNEAELSAAVEKLGDKVAAAGRFSGAVLVAVDGKPLVDRAWGSADREHNKPNTPQTAFDTGSLGKLLTQVAILQLVEAGKVSLDASFGDYVPDYPNADVAKKVTVRQLLLHASGMGDIAEPDTREAKAASLRRVKDFVPLFADEPLAFAPGAQTKYSNAGYVVLGLVIEAVSGEDYFRYVKEHVLAPAGMERSGFFDRGKLPENVARSYDDGTDVTEKHPVCGSPAGGLQATTGDLQRLVQAIGAGKLVRKNSIGVLRDLIPRPPNVPPPADANTFAGYGVAGGAPGVNAQLNIDPSGRYVRIVLCNGSPPMASSMAVALGEWLKKLSK